MMLEDVTVVVPCCGESTRYGGGRPKWALTHPSGAMMAVAAVRPLLEQGVQRALLVVRQDHLDALRVSPAQLGAAVEAQSNGRVRAVVVERSAGSHAADCAQGVVEGGVAGPVLFKDCDNAFRLGSLPFARGAFVCTVDLASLGRPVAIQGKTFIQARLEPDGPTVREWAFSDAVYQDFACGGYFFDDATRFVRLQAQHLHAHPLEVAGSYVRRVGVSRCSGYEDWGTIEDWKRYRARWKTVFCDIDGVLVEAGNAVFAPRWGECEPIEENCQRLIELLETGEVEVVLTTARPESERAATEEDLRRARLPLERIRILYGLPHAARFLVNDVVPERGEQSAFALNLPRNAPALRWML